MAARVRIDGNTLEVVGHGAFDYYDTVQIAQDDPTEMHLFVGEQDGVGPASLPALRQAILRWRRRARAKTQELDVNVLAASTPETNPFTGDFRGADVGLLRKERLLVPIGFYEAGELAEARRLLAPILKRHKASPESVELSESGELLVDWPIRGKTVADALAFRNETTTLLSAAKDGKLTRSAVLDLLRSGRWEVLKGQPESDWLEAKGAPYKDLKKSGKYELAKDVAAFANSPGGGVILFGLTTDKKPYKEIITGCKEIDLSRDHPKQLRDLVHEYVYPRVNGLEVENIPGVKEGRGFVAITIPPQEETDLPFLVQGAFLGGRVRGNHVLIPVRDGADTAAMDAKTLHAHLRIARQRAGEMDV